VTSNINDYAARTLSADLLRTLVDELRTLQNPWHATPEAVQEQVIDRLRVGVLQASARAVGVIASAGFTSFAGKLESLSIKDGIKANLKLDPVKQWLDVLVEDVGSNVMLVIASPQQYAHGIEEVKGDPDQTELPIGPAGEAQPQPEDGAAPDSGSAEPEAEPEALAASADL
jgi:hypothetical protein